MTKVSEFLPSFKQTKEKLKHLNVVNVKIIIVEALISMYLLEVWVFAKRLSGYKKRLETQTHVVVGRDTELHA